MPVDNTNIDSSIVPQDKNLPQSSDTLPSTDVLQGSLYDVVSKIPRPISQRNSQNSIYDTVTGTSEPVVQDAEDSSENKDKEKCDHKEESCTEEVQGEALKSSIKNGEESPKFSNRIDKIKSSSKQVKKADSLKDLARKVSNEGRGVQRSTSFTKRALMKMSGKKEKGISTEGAKDDETYAMIDKAHGTLYVKKKKFFSSWRQYFFVLDGSQLTYFTNLEHYQKLTGCQGSVDLTLLESVMKKKPTTCFKTYYPLLLGRRSRTPLYLGAEDETEQTRWLELLQRALSTRRAASERVRKNSKPANACSPDVVSSTFQSDNNTKSQSSKDKKRSNSFKRKFSFRNKSSGKNCDEENVKKECIDDAIVKVELPNETKSDDEKNDTNDNDEELVVKPKPIARRNMGVPSSAILSVKLKKTSISSEKEALSPVVDNDTVVNFGVQLKKRRENGSANETDATIIENHEHDFRSILKSRKVVSKTSPRTNHQSDSIQTDTLQFQQKKRSPSPNLPISKSLKSVLDKSTDDSNLIEIQVSEVGSESKSVQLENVHNNDAGCSSLGVCEVNHAVAENIRYSDPPGELEVFTDLPSVCTYHSEPTIEKEIIKESSVEKDQLNKQIIEKIDSECEDDIGEVKKISQLQNVILLANKDHLNSMPEELIKNTPGNDNDIFMNTHENNDNGSDCVNVDNLPIILDNESSISLSPKTLNKPINIDHKTSLSLNDIDLTYEDVSDLLMKNDDSNTASATDIQEDTCNDKIENESDPIENITSIPSDTESSEIEVFDPAEDFEFQLPNIPDLESVELNYDDETDSESCDKIEKNTGEQYSADQSLDDEHQVHADLQKNIEYTTPFGMQVSLDRSSSVESGEPLARTSFMGGRRSWSSISNFDSKVGSNSESSTSKESMEVALRCDNANSKNSLSLLSPYPNKITKRNSSGDAEILTRELTTKRQRRPISNPITNNRKSLISPQFIVVEEADGTDCLK